MGICRILIISLFLSPSPLPPPLPFLALQWQDAHDGRAGPPEDRGVNFRALDHLTFPPSLPPSLSLHSSTVARRTRWTGRLKTGG
jgi:hypothetical protein